MEEKKVRRKRKLGSYPFVSVIFSITLALIVVGLLGLMIVYTSQLTTAIKENVEVQVYLNKSVTNNEVTRIRRTITSKPYILKKQDRPSITHITKDQAAAEFIKDTGEDFRDFLGDNPLRDLFVMKIQPEYQSVDSLSWISKEIQSIRGVYEVTYVESLVRSINNNLAKIGVILVGFAIILVLVVVILINNTIKLALFSQRFLIRSMQLVGATSKFIRRPFLQRSAAYGFFAGIFSCSTLYLLIIYANRRVEDLQNLVDDFSLVVLFGGVILLGILVAYLSTYQAIRRYLKTSLDELY
ncbi:MAG: permease-like cell division protein FtsX [Cyclobacteriaceae bacterium]|nr:permease-like cell division protein FtsX [Cyclobacteriaceae bacterium HetDA_MAG_MS6]